MSAPEITQEHIDITTRIARKLARTPLGGLAGADELESQALVVLWDLACTWESGRQQEQGDNAFDRHISSLARLRLTDWLRSTYGRAGDKPSELTRLCASFAVGALDDDDYARGLPGTDPTPEQAVMAPVEHDERVAAAREALGQVFTFIRQECTAKEQRALRASMRGESRGAADDLGMRVGTFYTHATHARTKIRAHFETGAP